MNVDRMKFQNFLKQTKGVDARELHVTRQDKRDVVLLRYNAPVPKKRQRLTGEWRIQRRSGDADRPEAEVREDIKAFLEMARKHFVVRRGEGLDDEAFADEAMEAKGTPIVKEEEEAAK